jgi:hypothetical protein
VRRRRIAAAAIAALALAWTAPARADTLAPSQWPAEARLGSAPNAIRFGGTDRYATSLALSLALRGSGGFPFDTPDRTSSGATSLADAHSWWGGATCPSSVIVVAGDTPADALAAASLSDPTNRSDEPRLERVAAGDPLFDPIGGFDRVDTFAAPIIVTASARSGSRALSSSARTAVSDLRRGGCTSAREAIIVGGDQAVPKEAEGELVSLGYDEVFRVAGADRYDTAARIATALGTEAPPVGEDCADERADDAHTEMGFHGNAVIEYRPTASSCELHGRTVVLADGSVGADALAAGWWTSYWQVPVLLVDGNGSLPPATRSALQTMAIDTIVVLGGTGRIPESTVTEATRLAGAVAGRFAGRDRYDTSVLLAEVFGGWYPADPAGFEGDRICVASSSGTSVGWPDALSAGPWCGRLTATAAARSAPSRTIEPVAASAGPAPAARPGHDAAPVILVPPGANHLPSAIAQLLETAFTGDDWCEADVVEGCRPPGFAVAFGGSAVVSDAMLRAASDALSGATPAAAASPVLRDPFRTELDLAPVYARSGSATGPWTCIDGGGATAVRWLAVYESATLTRFSTAADLVTAGRYDEAGRSVPLCVPVSGAAVTTAAVLGVGGDGRATAVRVLRGDREHTIAMSGAMAHSSPATAAGEPTSSDAVGTTTEWHFTDAPSARLELRKRTAVTQIHLATLDLYLTRTGGGRARFVAHLVIDDGAGGLVGDAAGEAVRTERGWELAGRFRLPDSNGGFRGTVDAQGTSEPDDDGLRWQVDAAGV